MEKMILIISYLALFQYLNCSLRKKIRQIMLDFSLNE